MRPIPTFAALLLAFALGQGNVGRAGQATFAIEPVGDISQEARKPIQFTLTVKGGDSPRFKLLKVLKDGESVPSPKHIVFDGEKGTFSWTATPSQTGKYELTITARDAKGQDATTSVRITVRPGPITTSQNEVGKLLAKWHAEGTAAGNTGDFYDNRDGDHSPLSLTPWPQLDQVLYTPEDRKLRRDWAAQGVILPHVTFGNSSTSAPPTTGGSNVRSYYANGQGIPFLYRQYRAGNVYIYPEHLDHDPGHNGKPGYGDLYPTNTPFLFASQGSSGSDQPFMRAIPYTLAAFRPEVKKKLIEAGLLMPTLQMVFRMSNRHLANPKEYLTGKAHPTVFEGSWVNDLKMVQLAHEITAETIPPLVQLKVVEEDVAVEGQDYFDPGRTEKHADTPVVISRIARGPAQVRKMVVSAEGSADVNNKPLTYHWVVLRGDAERIKIVPKKDNGSVVELQVPYHERYAVKEPAPIDTNRVDIGVFVHNGAYYSAPGFVTYFFIDHEARTYDDKGRLLEIGHGLGTADVAVADWNALFGLLRSEEAKWPVQLLKKQFKAEELAPLAKAGDEYKQASGLHQQALEKTKLANEARQKLQAVFKIADEKLSVARKALEADSAEAALKAVYQACDEQATADETRRSAEADYQATQKASDAAGKSAAELLNQKREGLELPTKALIERALGRIKDDPTLFVGHPQEVEALLAAADAGKKTRLAAARKRATGLGVLRDGLDGSAVLRPIREGPTPAAERLTRYERNLLERFHAELLADLVYPGIVTQSFRVNFVDLRIATPRSWRDVFKYDDKSNLVGWARHDGEAVLDFNADGFVVLDKDDRGRAVKARSVRYAHDDPAKNFWSRTLKQSLGNQVVTYEYDGPDDRKGKITKREMIEDKKP